MLCDFKPASRPLLCSQKSLLESEKNQTSLHGRGFAGILSEFNFCARLRNSVDSKEKEGIKEEGKRTVFHFCLPSSPLSLSYFSGISFSQIDPK